MKTLGLTENLQDEQLNKIQERNRREGKVYLTDEVLKHSIRDEPLTRNEVAAYFKVSKVTIWSWGKKGILNPYRMGNKIYYWKSEIEKAMIPVNSNFKK